MIAGAVARLAATPQGAACLAIGAAAAITVSTNNSTSGENDEQTKPVRCP